MRFLSHIREFSVQIIEPRMHPTQYGDMIVDREGYVAYFRNGDVTDADIEYAERVFVKEGLLYGRKLELDEVTPVSLISRLSVFDTDERALAEDWEPEFKELCEEKLATRSIDHPDYRLMTELPIQAPWPRYLDFRGSLAQLIEKIVEDGHDPRDVVAYERQSGHRQAVIEALDNLVIEQALEAEAPQAPPQPEDVSVPA